MTKVTQHNDITVQIDREGTQAGIFNESGDPVLSFIRPWKPERTPDEWILTWPTEDGSQGEYLGVTDREAVDEALTIAREHLHAIGFGAR